MEVLRDFLKPQYEGHILPLGREQTKIEPKITFNNVWCLFPSGTDVYVRSADKTHASVVRRVNRDLECEKYNHQNDIWYLESWHLATDGDRIARTAETVTIAYFEGVKDV